MFLDYYAILEIDEAASQQQISAAFKNQALKWHPDKNQELDATQRMQLINEANLILKDPSARELYDKEYQKFKSYKLQSESKVDKGQESHYGHKCQSNPENINKVHYEYEEYNLNDDILKSWIDTARNKAKEMGKQAKRDFAELTKIGIKAFFDRRFFD